MRPTEIPFKSRRPVGKRHRDSGSLADLALDIQSAFVKIDRGLGDRQSETPALLRQVGIAISPGKGIG